MLCVQTEGRSHLLVIADNIIGLFLRRTIVAFGRALDIYAVLVGAGEKECINSLLSFVARDRVSHNHRVQVTKMRKAVGVIDWRGDVESFHAAC